MTLDGPKACLRHRELDAEGCSSSRRLHHLAVAVAVAVAVAAASLEAPSVSLSPLHDAISPFPVDTINETAAQ